MIFLYKIITFLVFYIALPFTYSAYLFGSVKWGNRLGFIKQNDRPAKKKCDIWLHASSMGEVKVLWIIVDELYYTKAEIKLHITVMTSTGYELACRILGERATVSYLPLDYRTAVSRFLNNIMPSSVVFIETEIWPNIILELSRRNISVYLANGRLSRRSSQRYRWFKSGLKKVLNGYAQMMVQSDSDRERFIQIGATPDKIKVLGSLKFDAPMQILDIKKANELKDMLPFDSNTKILIAGSTRGDENQLILDCYKRLLSDISNVGLIIAPRHLERVPDVKRLITERGMKSCLYSDLKNGPDKADIVVLDRMGILSDLYAIGHIAFVGGTLVDIGGQNILEPVWSGTPVLYGPSIYNVRDSSEYIISGDYGEMVQNPDELYKKLKAFMLDKKKYNKKSAATHEPTKTKQTVAAILSGVKAYEESLAENN